MVKVEFLGPIGKEPIEIDAKSLTEVAEILKKDPEIKEWLEQSAVAVNDTMVNTLDIKLKDGDRVSLLPPVCGG
ncbi:MoaD/ThiS family protein [Hydrogenimonas thermophila]|uniref:MoaD/ThiS family protein n=1 Tax=Hydrogenimonas thermophila TaxID=223786 RepID=UPI002936F46D|nr:MoaD/ThiS family protein [Hydrogenimonas thermophila]WOE70188.1 MoaD/ThiS family protein [Hydrogenimonas thermophila]WOE72705.1 MoaD/ThiS family protein [Hydrogenimonas thermophila]